MKMAGSLLPTPSLRSGVEEGGLPPIFSYTLSARERHEVFRYVCCLPTVQNCLTEHPIFGQNTTLYCLYSMVNTTLDNFYW